MAVSAPPAERRRRTAVSSVSVTDVVAPVADVVSLLPLVYGPPVSNDVLVVRAGKRQLDEVDTVVESKPTRKRGAPRGQRGAPLKKELKAQ